MKGCKYDDLKKLILEEINARMETSINGFDKEYKKYPEVKENLINALSEFEEKMKDDSLYENDVQVAFNIQTGVINPLNNIFQHMMMRQAEGVAFKALIAKVKAAESYDEIDEAFKVPPEEGSYWERSIFQCSSKNYQKILNNSINKALQCFKTPKQ